METYLSPVEAPKNVLMKVVYFFTRKRFGKVLAPLKVHSARLPIGFGLWYAKISGLDKKLVLPIELVALIREQVARINVCLYCQDIGRWLALQKDINPGKLNVLGDYSTHPLFSDKERAALDYVTQLTANKTVTPETFLHLKQYYSEREICEIVWLVASEHVYNMTNIGLNIHSDMLCSVGTPKGK